MPRQCLNVFREKHCVSLAVFHVVEGYCISSRVVLLGSHAAVLVHRINEWRFATIASQQVGSVLHLPMHAVVVHHAVLAKVSSCDGVAWALENTKVGGCQWVQACAGCSV